jgi:hypothetical protein
MQTQSDSEGKTQLPKCESNQHGYFIIVACLKKKISPFKSKPSFKIYKYHSEDETLAQPCIKS